MNSPGGFVGDGPLAEQSALEPTSVRLFMHNIPHAPGFDSTIALLCDGYDFGLNNYRHLHSDIFETRLLLQKTICMRGEEAASVFYDNERFCRHGAMPARAKKTLLGEGGVQGLDDAAHRHRKQMFVVLLMTPERIAQLADISAAQWRMAAVRWTNTVRVVLFPELQEILCHAVCKWAGVPLSEAEARERARDFGAMIDGGGGVGPRYWRGRLARKRAEQWITEMVEQVRSRRLNAGGETALHVIAHHRELNGDLLESRVAAVELINVLRPTVAIAQFVTFGALALHEHPQCRQQIIGGEPDFVELFVQEVRRYYPFFPFVAARVRKEFEWKGYRFPQGRRVMLDLYGTDHDPRTWEHPHEFQPERFRSWNESAFNFIPHGGGDHRTHHRCPGEGITIALMKVAMHFLAKSITYVVPAQDLKISMSRMPTLPQSGFVMEKVRLVLSESPDKTGKIGELISPRGRNGPTG